MIQLKAIHKTYQGETGSLEALRGVSAHIREGEIFGVIGKSGAGKSTLIRCINMLERPTHGSVVVDGEELSSMPERQLREARKKIGMIFQHFNLLSSRTVYGNVAFPLELAGKSAAEIAAAVDPLLELVGLADKKHQYPSQLSGGQKQRVGIARALANEPRVLLCDEATSALDPETTQSILELLADINRRLGLTIVLITHQMQVIKAVAHRVLVLEHGKLVEQGDVADIFTEPKHEITRTMLREVIGSDIPPGVRERAERLLAGGQGRIWRLTFRGEAVDRPALTVAGERFGIVFNILHGYIDEIQGLPFGALVVTAVAAQGAPEALREAQAYLATQEFHVEEVAL